MNTKINNKFLILLLALIFSLSTIKAQHFIVGGTVYDETMIPLHGANIIEVGTSNGTVSNENGLFSLQLMNFLDRKIEVMFIGYHSQTIDFAGVHLLSKTDTVYKNITVQLEIDTTDYTPRTSYRSVYSMIIATTVSRVKSDMSSFTELPTNYIDGFNSIEYIVDIEAGGYYNSIFGSAHYSGSVTNPLGSNDSIEETAHLSDIGVKFGYGFATRNYRLVFTPYLGLDVLFYQLKTADPNNTIPLNQYLENQYYHVTFSQWTSTLGGNLDIKLFGNRNALGYASMHLRMGAGYMFRLSKHPHLKAPTNELTSDGSVDMSNLYLNAGLVFYIQN